MVSYGMVSHGMVSYGVVSNGIVSYGVVYCSGGYVGLQEAFHHLAASQAVEARQDLLHPSYF